MGPAQRIFKDFASFEQKGFFISGFLQLSLEGWSTMVILWPCGV
jgi:hypothetical protein